MTRWMKTPGGILVPATDPEPPHDEAPQLDRQAQIAWSYRQRMRVDPPLADCGMGRRHLQLPSGPRRWFAFGRWLRRVDRVDLPGRRPGRKREWIQSTFRASPVRLRIVLAGFDLQDAIHSAQGI